MRPADELSARELADLLAARDVSKEALDAIHSLINRIRTQASANAAYGFSDEYGLFIRKMFLLNPQMYGGRVQSYLARRFGLSAVAATQNKGDLVDCGGRYFEMKFSFVTPTKPHADLVQLRLFQDIHGYIVAVADASAGFRPDVFLIPKNRMAQECEENGATSAHGTKQAIANNATVELRMSVDTRKPVYARWRQEYLHVEWTKLLADEA